MNRQTLAPGEWYHCYSRGVDKRTTFIDDADYKRFQELLFLCNSKNSVHRSNIPRADVFLLPQNEPLIKVATYCLMPNHFHLLIQEIETGGITSFMRKLGTGYTMYFNKRYERVGNLFVKPFRSKHVIDDVYAKQVSAYIHLNPLDIYQSNWKENPSLLNLNEAYSFLKEYKFSSLADYVNPTKRNEGSILSVQAVNLYKSYGFYDDVSLLIKHAFDFLDT